MAMWDAIKDDIKADAQQMDEGASPWQNRGFHALLAYRVAHQLASRGIPFVPLVLTRLIQILYSIDIDYRAELAGGIKIIHGMGLVIGQGAKVGRGTLLYHGVTLGIANRPDNDGFPVLGEDVFVGAGAKILGKVTIGSKARIGANAVVVTDVPSGGIAVGVPARVVTNGGAQSSTTSAMVSST